jgi:hypothetical protein
MVVTLLLSVRFVCPSNHSKWMRNTSRAAQPLEMWQGYNSRVYRVYAGDFTEIIFG